MTGRIVTADEAAVRAGVVDLPNRPSQGPDRGRRSTQGGGVDAQRGAGDGVPGVPGAHQIAGVPRPVPAHDRVEVEHGPHLGRGPVRKQQVVHLAVAVDDLLALAKASRQIATRVDTPQEFAFPR